MRLDGRVSASVYVVLGVSPDSVLGSLLLILYTSEFFYIVGNHIVRYTDDTAMYAVIPRPLSLPQVIK